jgi:hypothetical protein
MKYLLPLAILAPTAALAHAGDHFGFSPTAMLGHLLSQPDHVAMIAAGFAVAGLLVWRARARK